MKYYDILKLMEAKQVGILYHYTTIDNMIKIINTNTLKSRGMGSFVSFTRNKHFHDMDDVEIAISGADCRFVIDGDKLSNNYKIEPFNYFKDSKFDDIYYHDRDVDEQEERAKGNIKDFAKYIIKLEINQTAMIEWNKHRDKPKISINYYIKLFNTYCPTEWMR